MSRAAGITNSYGRLTPKLALNLAAPHTWAASVLPSLFGLFYCSYTGIRVGWIRGILLLAACVLMQSSVNTINDYVDYVKGTDSADDDVEINDAVLVYWHLNPGHVLALGLSFLGIAGVIGLYFILQAGPVPLVIGLIGAAAVVLYSGGPIPVSYLPIGEFVSGIVMGGLIPAGIAAALTGKFRPDILPVSLPLMIGISLIMMSNNGCDIEKDRRADRRTLPTYMGRARTIRVYHTMTVIWLALLCVLSIGILGLTGMICPVLILILGRKPFRFLLQSQLRPDRRVLQMKNIVKANWTGNGVYVVTFAAAAMIAALHG